MAKSDILAAIKDLQTSLDIQFQATTKLFQQFTTCVDTHFIQLSSSFPSQPPPPPPPPPTLSFHSPPLFFSPPAPSAAAAIPSSHPYSLQSQAPTPPTTSALRRVPPFPQPLAAPLLLPKSTDIPPPKQPPPPMLHPSPPPVLPPSLSPPKPPPPTDPPLNFIDISPLFRSLPIPPLIPKSPLAISVEIRCADLHTTHRSSEFSYTASSSRSTGHTQINPPQNSVPQAQIPTCSLPQSSPAVLPTPHFTQLPPQKWSNIHRCRSQFLLLVNNDEEEDSGDPEPPDLALEDKVTVGDISIIHTLTGSNTIDNRVLIDKEIPSFRIFAGNGDFLIGTRLCTDVLLRTQGHTLSMDSHIVAVERPSVVLSIQWLQRLGPVYAKEEMKFSFNSTRVQLCGEPPPETSIP